MKHIKNVPHYIQTLINDVTKYKSLRETMYYFLFLIVWVWIVGFTLGVSLLNPMLATILTVLFWLMLYFRFTYPNVDREDRYK